MDLLAELETLVGALDDAGVEYALCGGLAMAVYGVPRATLDIDVLVLASDVDRAVEAAQGCGFVLPSGLMEFRGGSVRIRRVVKPGGPEEESIPLDIIEAGEDLKEVWDTRREVRWMSGVLAVVGKGGLAALKRLRGSLQDQADIAALENSDAR